MTSKTIVLDWFEIYFTKSFDIEKNLSLPSFTAPIYAKRKASFGGKDHFMVVLLDDTSYSVEQLDRWHQEYRKFVNSQYKVPKAFRMKVPNIVTIFVSYNGFSEAVIKWSALNTRTMLGGEVHSVCLVDMEQMRTYGQGISYVRVSPTSVSMKFAFKEIDPQNRTYKWMKQIMAFLEDKQKAYLSQPSFILLCPYCGSIIEEDTIFCPYCQLDTRNDAVLELTPEEYKGEERKSCEQCNGEMLEYAFICPRCRHDERG